MLQKIILTLALVSAIGSAQAQVDPALPSYSKTSGVSGNFSSIGSDTLANLMTLWAEAFKGHYPNVNIQIQAAGSSTAPPGLIEGTANFGPMSRQMKSKEIEDFEKRYGYKPFGLPVAIDALAVFVHKDNPIVGMNLAQVDAVFSSTLLCGAQARIDSWGDAGLSGAWTSRDIQLFGRNSVSGTYGYFKSVALCKGDFRNNVNEQPGSSSVVQSVSSSINGIGYSGIGYKTASVRVLPLAKRGSNYVEPNSVNAVNGSYPLSRFLYVYVNKAPNQPLSPMEREFVKLVLSKQGQEVVVKDGYIPLPAKVAERYAAELEL